jgi:hypothetical protein
MHAGDVRGTYTGPSGTHIVTAADKINGNGS